MEFIFNEKSSSEQKLSVYFEISIAVIWFALIFSPFDIYATEGDLSSIQIFFKHSIIFGRYTYFQALAVFFLLYIYYISKGNDSDKKLTSFSILSLILLIISFFNPNNNIGITQYIFDEQVFNLVYLVAFSIVLFRIDIELYSTIFNKIFTIGLYILLIRCIQSLLLYFTGYGAFFSGSHPSTIPQMDTLIIISVMQLILFANYLNTRRKILLLYILIFYVTLLFSYRRSALGLSLIADLALFLYYLYTTPYKVKAIKALVNIVGALVILTAGLQFALPGKMENMFNRFAGAFSYFSTSANLEEENTDSGHMEQSIETTMVFLERANSVFWGAGYGNPPLFVEGQVENSDEAFGGIHNSFVLSWAIWGLHATLYLIILIFILFKLLFRLIKMSSENYNISGIIIYLLCFLFLGWSNGILFLEHLQYIIMFVLLISIIKFVPINEIPESYEDLS